eukprot:gnl/TRDRNA2_/TRDRNA2_74733_c0_seq1.p1 gnl/TRDRNA2_/TRDRNA2_74733_c0~~gnl/TRDRNA2_/TRDRNA2_74733_c0_seq1.p1  ORF type:complete len:221 (-),score=17.05 gnl/TRDRNA2_/TRDRNA2_74733_c0_seq1:329-991(-)
METTSSDGKHLVLVFNASTAAQRFVKTEEPGEEDLTWEQYLALVAVSALLFVCLSLPWILHQLCLLLCEERGVHSSRALRGTGLSQAACARLLPQPAPHAPAGCEATECCICMSSIDEGMPSLRLPCCAHLYHYDCVMRWLVNVARCPMCRGPVGVCDDAAGFVEQEARDRDRLMTRAAGFEDEVQQATRAPGAPDQDNLTTRVAGTADEQRSLLPRFIV